MPRAATDTDRPWRPGRLVLVLGLVLALALTGTACAALGHRSAPHSSSSSTASSASHSTSGSTTSSSTGQRRRAPDREWLGLNYNSSSRIGSLSQFSRVGIAWDREGPLEVGTGDTPSSVPAYGKGLRVSLGAGMIPDVLVDTTLSATGPSGCSGNPSGSDRCLPTGSQINNYVRGFVRTASATIARYPSKQIVFEPMDEPWDWGSPGAAAGRGAATRYAAILARLLPALTAAHIPLSRVYVPFTGELPDGTQWIADLYRAQPCLAPGPRTCGPIEAWNVHVYGTPRSTTNSLGVVAGLRGLMRSGAGNVIVGELGFCATNVQGGEGCQDNTPEVDAPSATVAGWLGQVLRIAAPMHAAGWLRAVILWDRSGGGWSIQLPDGQLTGLGRTLVGFARSQS